MLKKCWLHVKRQWFPRIFAYSAKMTIRLLLKTCRVNIHGLNTFISTAEKKPCMLLLWHNKLLLISEILNTHASQYIYTAFISKSRDGDPLAILATSYSSGRALRVPHNARHVALNHMIESLKNKKEIMIITPDGPRGPRGIVKPGSILAARETQANIFPFSWKAKRFWQLKTWDEMKIPKPFTTIEVSFGSPIRLDQNQDKKDNYEKDADLIKNVLDEMD